LCFGRERVGGEIDAGEMNGARRGLEDSGDHSQGRRLSRSVRAEEAEQLSVGDAEVDRVDVRERAVFLGETLQFYHFAFGFLNAISKAVRVADRAPARAVTMRPSLSTQAVRPCGAPSMRQARTVSRCAGIQLPVLSRAALSTTENRESPLITSSGRMTVRVVGSNTESTCLRPISGCPPSMKTIGASDGVKRGGAKV